MPEPIETRPFTIHPELFAWPSFRIFSERVIWLYLAMLALLAILLVGGLRLSIVLSVLTAVALIAVAVGLSFIRYKGFLRRPQNRQIFQNCFVSLNDEEVRQDFTDGSFLAIKLFAIKTFRDIGDFYFVFATPKLGIAVPKTAFESSEQSLEFAKRMRQAVARK